MKLLVSHINYPAQFRRLVPAWVAQGHEIIFLTKNKEWHAFPPEGFRLLHYQPSRSGGGGAIHPYIRRFEQAILEGQGAFRAVMQLKEEEGWEPDCVINHVGFGNGLYLSEAFPNAKRIAFFEWYYTSKDSDVDFLQRSELDSDEKLRLHTWNAQALLELASCDFAVTPTKWQQKQFPPHLHNRFRVIHEGVDTKYLGGLKQLKPSLPEFLPNDSDIEILTYVSRCFEEYRGFPQAMETIAELQKRRPHLHVLLVGQDGNAYGTSRSDGRLWSEWAREELTLDPARTHWLGSLQEPDYHKVLACSTVHFYLTVPFVLSWSLLEAMAAGCAIVASCTPPVEEVLDHQKSGLLVDFFNSQEQVAAIEAILENSQLRATLSEAAQVASRSYSFESGFKAWNQLLCEQTSTQLAISLA